MLSFIHCTFSSFCINGSFSYNAVSILNQNRFNLCDESDRNPFQKYSKHTFTHTGSQVKVVRVPGCLLFLMLKVSDFCALYINTPLPHSHWNSCAFISISLTLSMANRGMIDILFHFMYAYGGGVHTGLPWCSDFARWNENDCFMTRDTALLTAGNFTCFCSQDEEWW